MRRASSYMVSRQVQKLSRARQPALGESGHCTLERMAVYIRHARYGSTGDINGRRDGVIAADLRDIAVSVDSDDDIVLPSFGQPGGREAKVRIGGHAGSICWRGT